MGGQSNGKCSKCSEIFPEVSGNSRHGFRQIRDGKRSLLRGSTQDVEGGEGCLDSFHSVTQESVPNLTVPLGDMEDLAAPSTE